MDSTIPETKFQRWMRAAQRYEETWRKSNQMCFEYCDGDQWTPEEISQIEEREQQATVINTIQPIVDMVCSVENSRKVDIQVCGREEGDCNMAQLLTALLKHVFDTCHFEYYHSQCFKEALVGGRSWIECGIKTDERGKDLVKLEHVPWENVYLDPFSRKPDASDAKYIIKVKWIDRDMLKVLFPAKADEIDTVFDDDDFRGHEHEAQFKSGNDRSTSDYYDPRTNRVRVCECYYIVPERKYVKILNERTGKREEKEIINRTVRFVIFSDSIMLQGSKEDDSKNENPLGIDYFPLIPITCMVDRKGHPRGIVKGLIPIQDQINKLNSKFLWTIASNRVIMEQGAAVDEEEFRDEMQKPDGLPILNEGGLSKIKVDEKYRDLSYMSGHLNFLLSVEQRISGVNDSMLGMGGTNERSGVMQSTRINQGAAMQTTVLENFYFSKERIALVVLRLIGKFYTDYRVIRITQPNGMTDNYEFNLPEIDENGNPTGNILAKIEDTLYYDVILKKVPPFTSEREHMLQIFSEILKSGVVPAPIAAKMCVQLSDMPNKEDLIMEIENFYQMQQEQLQAGGGTPVQQ